MQQRYAIQPGLTADSRTAPLVRRLLEIPEMRQMIEQILAEGAVHIMMRPGSFPFRAYWDGDTRQVMICNGHQRSDDSIYSSIAFELHNAASNREFNALFAQVERGQISRWDFIERMERIEHRNAQSNAALLSKGYQMGLIPHNAVDWNVHDRFEDHFRLQQQAGHSENIGTVYDQIRATHRSPWSNVA